MIITDASTSSRGKTKECQECGDILNIVKFNALPGPVTARLIGGDEYWIESLCVRTGLMRLDVCGQIDLSDFSLVAALIDIDGNEHNPDDFWIED